MLAARASVRREGQPARWCKLVERLDQVAVRAGWQVGERQGSHVDTSRSPRSRHVQAASAPRVVPYSVATFPAHA